MLRRLPQQGDPSGSRRQRPLGLLATPRPSRAGCLILERTSPAVRFFLILGVATEDSTAAPVACLRAREQVRPSRFVTGTRAEEPSGSAPPPSVLPRRSVRRRGSGAGGLRCSPLLLHLSRPCGAGGASALSAAPVSWAGAQGPSCSARHPSSAPGRAGRHLGSSPGRGSPFGRRLRTDLGPDHLSQAPKVGPSGAVLALAIRPGGGPRRPGWVLAAGREGVWRDREGSPARPKRVSRATEGVSRAAEGGSQATETRPHSPTREAGPMTHGRRNAWAGSDRRSRLPPDWKARRLRVLVRDGWRCRAPGCGARATDVDHVERGDDHRDANLQALCVRHHREKTAREGVEARRLRGRKRPDREPHPGLVAGPGADR
jgi:5-methylcytosine-specific restriction enzyme A